MSVRVDTASLISGAVVVGNRGLGVTGAAVRAETALGDHGPGYLYDDWDGAADDAKGFRGLIVTPPSAGTFFAYENGSFTLTGAPDGAYSFTYRLFVDGADLGTATHDITIGTAAGNATGAPSAVNLTAPTAGANGGASAAGANASVGLTPAAGEGAGGAASSGAPAGVSITAPTGQASAEAIGAGAPVSVNLVAPPALGSGGATASGLLAALGLSAPTASALGATLPTIGRPAADLSQGAWLPSVGSDLYAMLDDPAPGGADYIFATTIGAICEMRLNETEFPGGTTQKFHFEADSSTNDSVIVTLKQGVTVIATWTQQLDSTQTTYSRNLTPGEVALIGPGAIDLELESA